MKDHSTQNRFDIAASLNVPNERIGQVQQIDKALFFAVNGTNYSASVTKTGRLKKNSVRLCPA